VARITLNASRSPADLIVLAGASLKKYSAPRLASTGASMSNFPAGAPTYEQSVQQCLMRLQPHLPMPPAPALALSERLYERICADIMQHGPLPFAQFMQRCLYEPGLGYYSAGLAKLGSAA
jgi:hypothetical protein